MEVYVGVRLRFGLTLKNKMEKKDKDNGEESDSTIENSNSEDGSDTEKGTSDSDSSDFTNEAREYHLGEPLGDSSSESEYCVVFDYLEAITEEDTDDMDTSDKE